MKEKSVKEFLIIVLLLLFISAVSFSQNNPQREKEQAAVKQLLDEMMQKQKSKTESKKIVPGLSAEDKYESLNKLSKTSGAADRKSILMNGNAITAEIHNYGGIGPGLPGASIREVGGMVWNNAPYIFQFCPIIGASVAKNGNDSDKIHIISDGLYDYDGLRDESLTGNKYVWQPLPGYADPDQPNVASNPSPDENRDGKPDSWPREWYNESIGEYVWPGFLKVGENNADLEVYWAMDDRDNNEFKYYPFNEDTTKRGLGVQIDGRAFQWSNSLAANALFVVYTITNVSDKDLDTVVFGIYGDPDVGGVDNDDDNGLFIPPYNTGGVNVDNIPVYARSMVYFFDPDKVGDRGVELGYLGCKFLESPGNPDDGIDNDGDGLIDERQGDGIDNDGDWDAEFDDVGLDGIPNSQDAGEGDGVPTSGRRLPDGSHDPLAPGEPNFEYTDLDEADQIGLTSFNSWTWNEDKISDDESMWTRTEPHNFSEIENNTDVVFIFGSGYISLKKGETKRISMAFLFGEDLNDLLVTAETVQDIYNKNYRFFKPPGLPALTAVPGDKKVTLFWDSASELSEDPITGRDFEGYVLYRSTDPDFSDIKIVTDGRGASYLYEPLKDIDGFEAKWDIKNEWRGYHPVTYQGRGVAYYLGDNTGLQHSFVDSNDVINGQTYYYALVAYDHGDSLGIPPSETTKKISVDPITSKLVFDPNTAQVIPGPRVSGYVNPVISADNITHTGIGNGDVIFSVINDLNIIDNTYTLTFSDELMENGTAINQKNYSVKSEHVFSEEVYLFDTKYASLSRINIIDDDALKVADESGKVYTPGTDYELDREKGKIKRTDNSTMPNNSKFIISYRYYPIYQSTLLAGEDGNPVFEGVHLSLSDYPTLALDEEKSGWVGTVDIGFTARLTSIGAANRKKLHPADYDITFSDQNIYAAKKIQGGQLIEIPVNYKVEDVTTGVPIPVNNILLERYSDDNNWTRGDEIILFQTGAEGTIQDTLTWGIIITQVSQADSSQPADGDILKIKTQRPYKEEDIFTLSTSPGLVENELAKDALKNVYVVPNPYVAANDLEPANRLSTQNRGERRIYFENLPQECTIRIFTLSGELVAQLDHQSSYQHGREYWNLLNKDGFSVAYGLYLAHIEAPGIGERIIKFALIK
ncbi:MAG: hypothetical protein JW995_15165 [Melioribacteraceae bacterium]|nr:hypothetical protein [Melioribacteraceae bacterium]